MYLKPEWLVCLLSVKVHQRTRTCSKFGEKQSVTGVRPSQFPTSLINNVDASQREGLWLKRILIGQLSYTITEREKESTFSSILLWCLTGILYFMTCHVIQFTHRRDVFLKGPQSLLQSVRHEQMSTAQMNICVKWRCNVIARSFLM